jgi:hypothetical protein
VHNDRLYAASPSGVEEWIDGAWIDRSRALNERNVLGLVSFGRDMVKSCVWRSGGFLSCDDFVVVPDSVLEGDSSRDVG